MKMKPAMKRSGVLNSALPVISGTTVVGQTCYDDRSCCAGSLIPACYQRARLLSRRLPL